jgi:hypothetical protein
MKKIDTRRPIRMEKEDTRRPFHPSPPMPYVPYMYALYDVWKKKIPAHSTHHFLHLQLVHHLRGGG